MSEGKKDLTSIEDLGEYLHELNEDDSDSTSEETFETDAFSSEADDSDAPETPDFSDSESGSTTLEFTEEQSFGDGNDAEVPEDTFSYASESDFSFEDTSETDGLEGPAQASAIDLDPDPVDLSTGPASKSPIPDFEATVTPEAEIFSPPETLSEVKQFAESSNFAGTLVEVNPSFSVLIRNVRYLEDVSDILQNLRELSLLSDSEEATRARLMRGTLLVPRISEFAAIFLAHKLRRFDVDIQVGLSDEIHPPKHGEASDTGIVSKHSLYQNQHHSFHFDDPKLELAQIVVAAAPSIEGFQVVKYVGVATEHKLIDGSVVEDEASDDIPAHYKELAQKLKVHALRANSNAVVGLNYQLTPLPTEFGQSGHKYRLTCTGNLVWVSKL